MTGEDKLPLTLISPPLSALWAQLTSEAISHPSTRPHPSQLPHSITDVFFDSKYPFDLDVHLTQLSGWAALTPASSGGVREVQDLCEAQSSAAAVQELMSLFRH